MTPERRVLRARIAALTRWSKSADRETTAKAGQAGLVARFEREVDPDGTLTPALRAKMASAARRAHMTRLALKRAA